MKEATAQLIARALEEDIGSGDITTRAIVKKDTHATARIVCKGDIVVSGLEVAENVFKAVDETLVWEAAREDGSRCKKGDILATIKGNAASLLGAERVALNFLQHLSGIATLTREFVRAVEGTGVKIVDTRKTIPGLRSLEKKAVVDGGGINHRMGLYDRYLIKDNHVDIAGNVRRAVEEVVSHRQEYVLIEVEVRNDDELNEVLATNGVDIIMLDNWPLNTLDAAIERIKGHCMIELSGGITREDVANYARPGVDYISVGALTHSAPAADISMKIIRA